MEHSTSNPFQWFLNLSRINKFEFLTLPLMVIEIYLSTLGYSVMSETDAVVSEVIRGIVIMIVGTTFIRWRIGSNDFRFKMVVHILNIVINTQLVTAVVDGDQLDSTSNIVLYLFVLLGHVGIVIISIFATFGLLETYTLRLVQLSKNVKSGDLSSNISEKQFVADKVLGPVTSIINEILEDSKNMFMELKNANQTIQQSYLGLSSSASQMNDSVGSMADTSQSMAASAVHQTELVNTAVHKLADANEALNDILKTIESNTNTVSSIALQTNILALNAGIEASRAGDYGRGFAVVAENVRKLSDESRKSAEQIREVVDMIADSLKSVFDEIQGDIINIASVSDETAAAAEEVASATEELAAGIEEVNIMADQLANGFNDIRKTMDSIQVT